MATSSLGLSSDWFQTSLPFLTGLLGLGSITSGSMGFLKPVEAPRLFGIVLDSASGDAKKEPQLTASQRAYIHIHGIRNISGGVALIATTLFWQFSSLCQSSPGAAEAVKRCLGITLLTGPITGWGDAWILSQFAKQNEVTGEAETVALEKSKGHFFTQLPIIAVAVALFFF